MKRLAIAATLFAAAAGLSLHGQTIDLTANIPFEFQVGQQRMPAGEYSVHHTGRVLMLRNTNAPRLATTLFTAGASRPHPPATGVLEFNRYGETYFLSKIWTPNSTSGAALLRTAREKELARNIGIVQRAGIPLQHK